MAEAVLNHRVDSSSPAQTSRYLKSAFIVDSPKLWTGSIPALHVALEIGDQRAEILDHGGVEGRHVGVGVVEVTACACAPMSYHVGDHLVRRREGHDLAHVAVAILTVAGGTADFVDVLAHVLDGDAAAVVCDRWPLYQG